MMLHIAAHIQKLRLSLLFMMHVIAFRSYLWIYSMIKHNVQELDLCLPIRTTVLLHPSLFTSKSLTTLKLVVDSGVLKGSEFCLLLRAQDLTPFICYIFGWPVLPKTIFWLSSPPELVLYKCVWNNINSITFLFQL